MKILELHIEGFRSLKNVTWKPGDLNVVIGPNGTGKSNLLRLLELISEAASGRLGKHIQASGGMMPIVWDGQAEEIIWKLKTSPVDATRDRDSLTYETRLGRIGKSSTYRIDYELLGNYHRVETEEKTEPFKLLKRRGLRAVVFDEQQKKLLAREEDLSEEETLLSVAGGLFSQNKLIKPYQQQLKSWSVYHDLHVNRDAPIRQPTIARHETRIAPDGQNLAGVLHTLYTGEREFKDDIDNAMRAAFGTDFDSLVFPPAADQRIQLGLRWKSLKRDQSAADVSDGTLRFLLLLTILASPDPAPVIAIDEPETGLHPSMLPIVAEYAIDAAQRSQVILTTHSPQLLDGFKDTIPTTTVSVWEDGQTKLNTLDGDTLREWLKGYSLGKLFRSGELETLA